MRKNDSKEQFYQLTPEIVLAGVESAGFLTTGEYIQLNSYENRVFDVKLEPESDLKSEPMTRVIVKYYRPGRWSRKAILEEHFFLEELKHQGIPVISPLVLSDRQTLLEYSGLYLALFKKGLGRIPQELNLNQLQQVGRVLARIHNVGEQSECQYRPVMTAENYGLLALDLIKPRVLPELRDRYITAADEILKYLDEALENVHYLRIHGDCHKGNLLQTDTKDGEKNFFFIDFDDFCLGPAAQDLWMLLAKDDDLFDDELNALLRGYQELRHFEETELRLFEPLRGLRILHYAGWIIRRWEDPSFPALFPDFGSYSYWAEETEALEKIAWSL